jgi:hypothetical protein
MIMNDQVRQNRYASQNQIRSSAPNMGDMMSQGIDPSMIQYSSGNVGSKKMNGANQSDIYKVYLNYMPNGQGVAFTPNQNNPIPLAE